MTDKNKSCPDAVGRRKNAFDVRRLTTLSLLVAVSMILSYVESQIPVFIAVPGVKLGLANILSVFALYTLGVWGACGVSLVRVCLSALLFGNPVSLIFSLSGAVLSLGAMILVKKLCPFSPVGVSVVGGVMHNVGQICAAAIIMETGAIVSYLPVLIISGTVAGVLVGLAAGELKRRLSRVNKK